LLSPVGDVEGFIRHVERLLDDPAAGVVMAKAARALYEAAFAWPRIAEAYALLLREDG
jgi:glycosyltransferase involved in cell wall biosynthesis